MRTFTYTIQDELGIHARPAGLLTKKASEFQSAITLEHGEKKADARRIMAVMALGVKQGSKVRVVVEGEDEDMASEAMEALFRENL